MMKMELCYVAFVAFVSVSLIHGEECFPSSKNPCRASCNGTTFDISELFDYPLNISGEYQWSPCTGMKCSNDPKSKADVALTRVHFMRQVCQYGFADCGHYERPVFILQQRDPYMFTIEYPFGVTWRLSMFQFIEDNTHPITKAVFTKEDPMLQYNFVVTGKCIGQPGCRK